MLDKLNWFERFIIKREARHMWSKIRDNPIGYKTLAGVLLMAIAVLGDLFGFMDIAMVDRMFGVGELVGIFGLRHAFKKLQAAQR